MSAMSFLQAKQLADGARNAGFRHYAFISYPQTDAEMKVFALKFHDRLEGRLRRELPLLDPSHDCAFLD